MEKCARTPKSYTTYVQEIKGKLFNTSRLELKNVVDKYSAKVPPSLSSQFKDRMKKADAVESYTAVSCR